MRPEEARGNEPRFDRDLAKGKLGEIKFDNVIDAIAQGKVEIKTDLKSATTGNFFVESMKFNQAGEFSLSGIEVTTSEYWVWAFRYGIVVLDTDKVRELYDKYLSQNKTAHRDGNSNSAGGWGVLVPAEEVFNLLLASQQGWVEEELGNDS